MTLYDLLKRLAVETKVATEGKNDHDWAVKALALLGVASNEAESETARRRKANPMHKWVIG